MASELTDQQKRDIELVAKAIEQNPLLAYQPHAKQKVFHESRDFTKLFAGGNRSGKTTAGIVDDLIQAVDRDVLPPALRVYKKWEPPFFFRIIAPKFNENHEGVTIPAIRRWVPRSQLAGGSWVKAYSASKRMITFRNGSWCQLMTFEQDLDTFAGAALHRVHLDEEPPGEHGRRIYNENLMRLTDYNGDLLLTMTPLFGLSWSYDEIWERRHEDGITAVTVDSFENPHVNHTALERTFARFTDEERKARQKGEFIHFGGLFYDEFNDTEHVVDPPKPKTIRSQDVVVGIDPGLNFTGVVWAAFDNDNGMFVFDELLCEGKLVPDVAQGIREKNRKWGINPSYYVIDPSARNRNQTNAENIEGAFNREGIYPVHGQNERGPGILEVKRRLQKQGFSISRECPRAIWEFGRYRKDPNSSDEFAAIKVDDHCFVAGTLIVTDRGEVPIEQVKVGDRAWSRDGFQTVVGSGPTRTTETMTLNVSDGRTVTATPDHPIWVEGKGFIRLDAVRYGDILLVCPSASFSTGTGSTVTPTHPTARTASTSRRASRIAGTVWTTFIGRFGKRSMAKSPKAITSTTGTATPSTTPSRILSASLRWITKRSIGLLNAAKRRVNTWTGLETRLRSGTDHPKGGSGTANMAAKHGQHVSRSHANANSVRPSSSPSPSATTTDFARTPASPHGDVPQGLTTRTECAPAVGNPSGSTGTPDPRLVRVNALGLSVAPHADVFALTVYGRPEYLANGVLVRNCLDALRYIAMERPWNLTFDTPREYRYVPGTAPPLDQMTVIKPVPPMGDMS